MPSSQLHLLQVQQSRAACPVSPLHPAGPGQLWAGNGQQELTCSFWALGVNHALPGILVLRGCRTLVPRSSTAAFNVIDRAAGGGWRLQAEQK